MKGGISNYIMICILPVNSTKMQFFIDIIPNITVVITDYYIIFLLLNEGYFLDPQFYYSNDKIIDNNEVMSGVKKVI